MSHNKGKRFILCKECNHKRYCKARSLPDFYREWECSKGHKWTVAISTLERVTNLAKGILIETFSSLSERDDTFYHILRKR